MSGAMHGASISFGDAPCCGSCLLLSFPSGTLVLPFFGSTRGGRLQEGDRKDSHSTVLEPLVRNRTVRPPACGLNTKRKRSEESRLSSFISFWILLSSFLH